MHLSKTKIAFFFVTIAVLVALLYPREFFMAYIYEGTQDLTIAEEYYLNYLKKNPNSKFAIIRLSHLYKRMALPEKALPLLNSLYEHRLSDWDTAMEYLNYLEEMRLDDELYSRRLKIAEIFAANKKVPAAKLNELLDNALHYALWHQKNEDAYGILIKLVRLADKKNKPNYIEQLATLDRGMKNSSALITFLNEQLKENPGDTGIISEIASIHIVTRQYAKAQTLLEKGFADNPNDLGFVRSLLNLYETLGQDEKAISMARHMLKNIGLSKSETEKTIYTLGTLLMRVEKYAEARDIFISLNKTHPEYKDYWKNLIQCYSYLNQREDMAETLALYLEKFPDDTEVLKQLVDYELYEQKNTTVVSLYKTYLKKEPRLSFAKDVAYLLFAKKMTNEGISWLELSMQLVGRHEIFYRMSLEALIELKAFDRAIALCDEATKIFPKSKDLAEILLSLAFEIKDKGLTGTALEKVAKHYTTNPDKLLFVGKEFYFLGEPDRATYYLARSTTLKPSVEANYYLGEIALNRQEPQRYSELAKIVVTLGKNLKQKNSVERRLYLKTKAKLALNSQNIADYQNFVSEDPDDKVRRLDLVDLLITAKRLKQARTEVLTYLDNFGADHDITLANARLSLSEKDYESAASLLETLTEKEPENNWLKTDLAFAYEMTGRWFEAQHEYENISVADQKTLGLIDTRLKKLHKEHDKLLATRFDYTHLTGANIYKTALSGRVHINKSTLATAKIKQGAYHTTATGAWQYSTEASVGLTNTSLKNTTVGIELAGARSTERLTPSVTADIEYRPIEDLKLGAIAAYRLLRTDLPTAISTGALEDKFGIAAGYTRDRLSLYAGYNFTRDYLSTGETAYIHTVEPGFNYTLVREPFNFALGYQMTFSRVDDQGGFLAALPLVSQTNAHYLTGLIGKEFDTVALEGGFFIGEDFDRNLHFFQADLWGIRGELTWDVLDWLYLNASYHYGRETLSTTAGDSHQVGVGVTGHWR